MGTHEEPRVARTIALFLLLGAILLGAVSTAGFLAIRSVATRQALDDAKSLTAISAGLVERRLPPGLATGDAVALGVVDDVVRDAILVEPVVRVKIWAADGTIVYSTEPSQIGQRFASGRDELEELAPGEVAAEVSDLQAPENEAERDFGELLEVYTAFADADGQRFLFETYQLRASVDEAEREILSTFLPVLVVALVAFAALMLPLAWSFARRLERGAAERERLLRRAVDASQREGRRIAGDLHDGPVQELAGLAMRLAAEAGSADDPEQRAALEEAAAGVRGAVRTLRSAVVGIYPPNLASAGLGPALSDLTARLRQEGIEVTLELEEPGGFDEAVDELLYRACREALRNVERHARADHVVVRLAREDTRAVLEVRDDGVGLGASADAERGEHLGLRIVGDLVEEAGGRVTLAPGVGGGTVVRVEVPLS